MLFTFHQLSVESAIVHHNMMKVRRWALFFSTFKYLIEHVDGESNDFPDMLTRWMKGYRSSKSSICRARKQITYFGIPTLSYSDKFKWPDLRSILNTELKSKIPKSCTKDDDNINSKSEKFRFRMGLTT